MTAAPLNYDATRPPTWWRRWLWRMAGLIVVGAAGAYFASGVTIRHNNVCMDAVTGSMSFQTTWLFGITSKSRVSVSPLETRLKQAGIPWTPSWQFVSGTGSTLFGRTRECAVGSTPIMQLHSFLTDFAATL